MFRSRRTPAVALASVLFLPTACKSDPVGIRGPLPDAELRVLFVGNSLTYTNDLPGMVQTIAEAAGHTLAQAAVAYPNLSLEDHWYRGVQREILEAEADIVVMQQGPSSLPQNQIHLAAWADTLATAIRQAGGEPALFMVWPEVTRTSAFDAVYQAYQGAATAVGGLFIPAGQAWLESWSQDPSLPFYGPDGFHPSPLGSQVAALTIYRVLFDADVSELPARMDPTSPGLPVVDLGSDAQTILQGVEEAVAGARQGQELAPTFH